jgi:hypothetical protein
LISVNLILQTMMFTTCHFLLISFLALSANAETVRGAHRELAATAVNLGTAGTFAILARTGITTTGTTAITGNIGVSPIAGTAMTGFTLIADSSGTFSTSTQVTGNCYAADYISPTPSEMTTAISDMETAYTTAAGQPAYVLELGAGLIGGLTLGPGVYSWTSDITITTDIVLSGSSTDLFILQTTQDVIVSSGVRMTLAGGALASNIVWQVAGFVDVGTTAHMEGVFLVKTHAVFKTGSSLNGRVLAQTAVTLDSTTIVSM